MKKLSFLLISIFLSGCGSTYKPPVHGSTAKLEIPRPYSHWNWGVTTFGVGITPLRADGCVRGDSIPSVKAEQLDSHNQIIVPAHQELLVSVGVSRGDSYCVVTRVVNLDEKEYVLSYKEFSAGCLAMIKMKDNHGGLLPIKTLPVKHGFFDVCKSK